MTTETKTVAQWAAELVAERRAMGAGVARDADGKLLAELGDGD